MHTNCERYTEIINMWRTLLISCCDTKSRIVIRRIKTFLAKSKSKKYNLIEIPCSYNIKKNKIKKKIKKIQHLRSQLYIFDD